MLGLTYQDYRSRDFNQKIITRNIIVELFINFELIENN